LDTVPIFDPIRPRGIRTLSMNHFVKYAINWGVSRVGRLFSDQGLPLSIALNALLPEQHPDVWKRFRSSVPKAPIIAHGLNNSTELLPLGRGLDAQKAYIRRTLDLIEKETGLRPHGWTSPSVYPNADTFTAAAAEGATAESTLRSSKGLRVGLHIVLLEACSAFTHLPACTLARSAIRDPLPEGFSPSSPPCLLRLLPTRSEIAEWAFHPLERRRPSTAHTLSLRCDDG